MSSSRHRLLNPRNAVVVSFGLLAFACDPPTSPPAVDGGTDAADGGPNCALEPLADVCLPTPPVYEGPTAAIEVLRDSQGIPHVYAATDADAFFGSGYMQAYDRLFQMDITRRRALGRRAEVLGASYVDGDRTTRIVDIEHWAEMNRRAMLVESPEEYGIVQAWIAGVNRRISEVTTGAAPMPAAFTELGYEPELWTEVDAFAVGKLILFGNAEQIQYDTLATIIRDVLPSLDARLALLSPIRDTFVVPPEERPIARPIVAGPDIVPLPPLADRLDVAPADLGARITRFFDRLDDAFGESGASNNWALEGRHTASGRPLIAGDPHQGLDSPSLMWVHHMHSEESGGALDVAGFSFVGSPAVQLGHNRHLAWTATTTYPDWMDLWEVRWNAAAGTVTVGDETLRVVPRTVRIGVAGEAAPREIVLEDVPGRGYLLPEDFFPIPLGAPGTRVLLDWSGFRPTHEAQGFFGFDVATNLDEFDAAADVNEIGAFNFLAASATGITYRSSPLTPVRAEAPGGASRRPWTLLDGSDVGTLWDGTFLRPGIDLPHSRGGTRGWIVSANNEPLGLMQDGSADGDPFYFGVFFDPGVRAARIEDEIERLVTAGGVTIEEMQTLQDDTHSEFADDLVPELLTAWDGRATDASLAALRDRTDLDALVTLLRGWDRRMERDSSAAVAFQGFNFFLARRVLADDFSLVFDPILGESPAFMFKFLVLALRIPDAEAGGFLQEGRSLLVVQALDDTAAWLTSRFGSTDPSGYTWGDVHFTCFNAVVPSLEGGCVATDGGEGTVNVSGTGFFGGDGMPRDRFESHGGSIYRLTATFTPAGRPQAFINFPRGVSGEPTSAFFNDHTDDWAANRYRELLFERADIEADSMLPAGGGTLTIPR